MEAKTTRTYLPAAGRAWLLPLYDPLTRLLGSGTVRRRLVELADIRPGQRVLEIGCGTGSLTILVKRLHPGAAVVGLDPDPAALARARRKADRHGVAIEWNRGFAEELPRRPRRPGTVLHGLLTRTLQVPSLIPRP
jgi:ubiquinone/menaquinone biosynthesis C-methylase UbiE